jgi:hypothetical protein
VRRLRDPRVWLGLGVTALALWFAFRGVSWAELGSALARANWWLLVGASVPTYLVQVWVRAERWRVLARGVAAVPSAPAYRATAIGFLVNNILPLRIGELVRVWWLAREIRSPAAALLGTLILERVIDMSFLLVMASFVVGSEVGQGVVLGGALVPLAGVLALRRWPAPALRAVRRVAGAALPAARADRVTGIAGAVARGLAGLRGGGDVAAMLLLTALLWGVLAWIPFWVALAALEVPLGGTLAEVHASILILVWVAVAVALPAAPGFFGPFHAACRYALAPLGVPSEVALAVGTLAHATFWVVVNLIGLACLRGGAARLRDAVSGAEQEQAAS